ncbi:hypothetical protein B0H17DRAFT_1148719 [Mycena rosella]|uniref:Uncharacterized protein n=1 Tax=Mycena rosella TaxID=1033263 RepID=A0AAD7FX71_MYCRO|nr:hypothetical protein B0H17DRAFT_1148719 [Mycena rosella]
MRICNPNLSPGGATFNLKDLAVDFEVKVQKQTGKKLFICLGMRKLLKIRDVHVRHSLTNKLVAQKARGRERVKAHYQKNGDEIREKRRIQMAEKRSVHINFSYYGTNTTRNSAAVRRRKSKKPCQLEPQLELDLDQAEQDAFKALTKMLNQQREASPLPPSSDEESSSELGESRYTDLNSKLEADWQKYLERLAAKGETYVSDNSDGESDAGIPNTTCKTIPETTRIRMCTPLTSPQREALEGEELEELESTIPSFYDKLWATVEQPGRARGNQ